jgi:hypothetical protein
MKNLIMHVISNRQIITYLFKEAVCSSEYRTNAGLINTESFMNAELEGIWEETGVD